MAPPPEPTLFKTHHCCNSNPKIVQDQQAGNAEKLLLCYRDEKNISATYRLIRIWVVAQPLCPLDSMADVVICSFLGDIKSSLFE